MSAAETTTAAPVCTWFLLCENVADRLQSHPVLGQVPTCRRCAEKYELPEAGAELLTVACPACEHELIPPAPAGEPGDDSWYCEGCGRPWSLDLKRVGL